jgi:hypothetical protein
MGDIVITPASNDVNSTAGTLTVRTSDLRPISLRTNDANRLYIDPTGKIAVGHTDANAYASQFAIETSLTRGLTVFNPNLTNGNIIYGLGFGSNNTNYDSAYIGFNRVGASSTSNYLSISLYNQNNILNVNGLGNVGIGLTNPAYKLQVNGEIYSNSLVYGYHFYALSGGTYNDLHAPDIALNSMHKGESHNYDLFQFRAADTYETQAISGGAWTSVSVPTGIFAGDATISGGALTIANGLYAVRFTWNSIGYRFFNLLYFMQSTAGNSFVATIEHSANGSTWTSVATTASIGGWPAHSRYINYWNNNTTQSYLRITLTLSWSTANSIVIYNMRYFCSYYLDGAIRLFAWDYNRNVSFPSKLYTVGNVGIGTDNPSAKLHINDSTTPYIRITRAGVPTWELRNNFAGTEYGFSFNNVTDSLTPLFIGYSGNIGINTTNPDSTTLRIVPTRTDAVQRVLHIGYNGSMTSAINGSYISFGNDLPSSNQLARIAAYYEGGTYQGSLRFHTNSNNEGSSPSERMRIDYLGNVGIGTSVITGRLNVTRNSNTSQPIGYFSELFTNPAATNIVLLERGNNLSAANQLSSNAGLRIRDHLANYSLSVEDHLSNLNFAISGTRVLIGTRSTNSLLNIGGAGSTLAASGITFGADPQANLYRVGEDSIKTDGNLYVAGDTVLLGNKYFNGSKSAYILARGTGANNSVTNYLAINGTVIIGTSTGRGLTLTIINGLTFAEISTTRYDTYGSDASCDSLATAINAMTSTQIGVITSFDAWERDRQSLRTAALNVGLTKLGTYTTGGDIRKPYVAIFNGTSDTANATSKHVIERMESSDADASRAIISTYLTTDGSYVSIDGALHMPNALYASDADIEYPILTVNSVGNVGIGTTGPAIKLHIVGQTYINNVGGAASNQLTLNSNGANYAHFYDLGPTFNTVAIGGSTTITSVPSTSIMTWALGTNNVGINVTTPAAKLDVGGTLRTSGNILSHKTASYTTSYPGINSFGGETTDSGITYYDTGKLGANVHIRGIVWTGKHYIFTDYLNYVAYFYDNNFNLINNAYGVQYVNLPLPSGYNYPHGAAWDGRYLWCVVYTGSASKIVAYDIDTASNAIIVAESAALPYGTLYDIEYADGHLYVVSSGNVYIYKWNGSSIDLVGTKLSQVGVLTAQAITYDGSYLWVTQDQATVYKLNLDGTQVATITSGFPPFNTAWAWNGSNIITYDYNSRKIYVINTKRLRIDTQNLALMGGNVGVGITNPSYPLHVANNSIYHIVAEQTKTDTSDTSAYATFFVINKAGTSQINGYFGAGGAGVGNASMQNHVYIGAQSNHGLRLFTNDTAKVTVQTDGNVGIGTTAPAGLLHVYSSDSRYINFTPTSASGLLVQRNQLVSSQGTTVLTLVNSQGPETSLNRGTSLNLDIGYGGSASVGGTIARGARIAALNSSVYDASAANQNASIVFYTATLGVLTEKVRIQADNKVGIGVSSPVSLLTVGGAGSTTAASGITFGAEAASNIYRSSTNQLKTDGSFVVSNTLVVGGGENGIRIFKDGSNSISSTLYLANSTNTRAYNFQQNAAGTNLALWGYNSSDIWQNLVNFNYNGSVGIGTTTPSGRLHVVSTTVGETVLRADGTNGTLFSVVDDLSDSLMSVNNSAGLPVLEVFADDRVVAGQYGSGDFVLTNNKIGIGTTNPLNKLTVIGNASIGSTTYNFSAPANGLIVQGNVGLGTTNPQYKLDVGAAGNDVISVRLTPGYERVRYYGFDLLGYNDGNLWMIGNNNSNSLILSKNWDWDNQIGITYTPNTAGGAAGVLQIGQLTKNNANYTHGITRLYTNGTERLTILSNGNVGISSNSPAYQLDVVGTSRTSVASYVGSKTYRIAIDGLTANATTGRRHEIARLFIDYNDWNDTGIVIIELFESYYNSGVYKKYIVNYGFGINTGRVDLVDFQGQGANDFQIRILSPVLVSGDKYYLPVYVEISYYKNVDVVITTNRLRTTNASDGPFGSIYINQSPSQANVPYTGISEVQWISPAASNNYINGNLGLGNTSPAYKLDVNGAINVNSTIYFNDANIYIDKSNTYDLLVAQNSSSSNGLYLAGAGNVYLSIDSNDNESNRAFIIQNNSLKAGNELFRFQENGRVGIGTNNPTRQVHIFSTGLADNSVNPLILIDGKFTAAGVDFNDIVGIAFRVENSAGGSQTTTCIGSSYQTSANALLLQPQAGNVGISTNNPVFKLDNYNNGFRSLANASEKFILVSFANGVANQKVDITFDIAPGTNIFWGNLEVEVSSGYSNQLSTGKLIKVFAIGLNPATGSGPYGSAIYDNTSYYTAAYGAVTASWAIDGIFFNTATGKYYFTIIHRTSTGNDINIKIKGFAVDPSFAANINSLTAGSVYTTNTTVYYQPVVETLQSRIGYNGNINQAADLLVQGSVGIGTQTTDRKVKVLGDVGVFKDGLDTISSQLYIANAANSRAYNLQLNAAGTNLALWNYNSLNAWINAVNFNYDGNVGIGASPVGARLHLKGDGSNPVLRVETALLLGPAGGTAGKTFAGWMPIQTGALSPADTVYIPLYK